MLLKARIVIHKNEIKMNFVSERRLVNRLHQYWLSLKSEDEDIPKFSKFNESKIEDMWHTCVLFSVEGSGKQPIFKLQNMGDSLSEAFIDDLKNRYFSIRDKSILPGSNFAESMEIAVRTREFIKSEGQFINPKNKIVKYRDCILPFSNAENQVSNLIIGLSWRTIN